MELSTDKTKAMVFSRGLRYVNRRLQFRNGYIDYTREHKYLGLTFDMKFQKN